MFRSMLRLLTLLIDEPATSIPTLPYYSGLLPTLPQCDSSGKATLMS